MLSLGGKIKRLRKEAGYSQKELGNAIGPVKQNTVSSWERGNSRPNVEDLKKICDLFNVTGDYLLGNTTYEEDINKGDNDMTFEQAELFCMWEKLAPNEKAAARSMIKAFLGESDGEEKDGIKKRGA